MSITTHFDHVLSTNWPFWKDIGILFFFQFNKERNSSWTVTIHGVAHARHFIFHARVPIVPSWQQFRLSYCVPWFLLIPRWLQWSGQSSSTPDIRQNKNWISNEIFLSPTTRMLQNANKEKKNNLLGALPIFTLQVGANLNPHFLPERN